MLSSVLGLSVAAVGAVRLIRSIQSIVRGAEAVEEGKLDTEIEIRSRDEIGRLAASFNRMTEGLRMRDRIRDVFGKYVDRRIAEQLIQAHTERGERREVAVMFLDLVGFTALSHRVEAERLVQFLNAYFSLIARQIASTDGVIDKYIGDGVMAYWCPPFVPQREVSLRSADAALRCVDQLPAMTAIGREIFAGNDAFEPRLRVGIASGESITGSIGAEERRNYTVIGDTVNLASRIEGATEFMGLAIWCAAAQQPPSVRRSSCARSTLSFSQASMFHKSCSRSSGAPARYPLSSRSCARPRACFGRIPPRRLGLGPPRLLGLPQDRARGRAGANDADAHR